MISIAVIGSSGGGTATLGHTDAGTLLQTVHHELLKADARIVVALFTSLEGGTKGFDAANVHSDIATLYAVKNESAHPSTTATATATVSSTASSTKDNECHVQKVQTGILADINKTCTAMDQDIAQLIRKGMIQGLVCISCHMDVHAATLQAAAEYRIPVTGSGGTSLSAAVSKFGIVLVGNAGGSVATTSYTRAVSYTIAMARACHTTYRPFSSTTPTATATNQQQQQQLSDTPQWTSVLNACLPAFWGVVLVCRILELLVIPYNVGSDPVWMEERLLFLLQTQALPTVCCIVMATSSLTGSRHHHRHHHHDEGSSTVIMAAAIGSVACQKSILAGFIVGWMVSFFMKRVLYTCIVYNIPATMTNLIVGGGMGSVLALLISPMVPYLQLVTECIRCWIVHRPMNGQYPGLGMLVGMTFCWASKVGYYHSICLPIILIEMELGKPSLWGTIDEASLVLVSAGICAANLITCTWHCHQRRRRRNNNNDDEDEDNKTVSLCWRGLRINILYGDFIEVAYPFMEASSLVNMAGYIASGLATELLTGHHSNRVMSSAYLPLPLSIWLADDWIKITFSYMTAFSVVFVATLVNNLYSRSRKKEE